MNAAIVYQDERSVAVYFQYDPARKESVKALYGTQWSKSQRCWLVPLARLGELMKIFMPYVEIDYEVLCARDRQIARMFRQYRVMGVVFWEVNGRLRSNNAQLDEYYAKRGTALHVQVGRAGGLLLDDVERRGGLPSATMARGSRMDKSLSGAPGALPGRVLLSCVEPKRG